MLELYEAYATYIEIMDLTEGMIRDVALRNDGRTHRVRLGRQGASTSAPAFRAEAHGRRGARVQPEIRSPTARPRAPWPRIARAWACTSSRTTAGASCCWRSSRRPSSGPGAADLHHRATRPKSPVGAGSDSDPGITDRFELFIGGKELANGFSELNDPEDQAARFRAQVDAKDSGDDEAMHFDADYIRALENTDCRRPEGSASASTGW
jgi:lysyl-tRNA synthetase class 2